MKDISKIIHIDMDAFFASIEQRNNPELKGKPVIVGGDPNKRGVVATCSYEARKYGIHSAMPSKTAYRLCPHAIFIRTRIEVYKAVSDEIMEIFKEYTDLVEPLSLDEAYLDVTVNKRGISSATIIAKEIKEKIYSKTQLTASAGVSCSKFLAKIASAYKKPDGLTIITPEQAIGFLDKLPVNKFFGVGKVTEKRMNELGIFTGADLKRFEEKELIRLFKERGRILYKNVRGEDERSVNPNRKRKSQGKEITLNQDIDNKQQMIDILEDLIAKLEKLLKKNDLKGTTITLKIKFFDFKTITRRMTVREYFNDAHIIFMYAKQLFDNVDLQDKKVRLLGVYISNFLDAQKEQYEEPYSLFSFINKE